jgi:hypothetical protein
MAAPQAVKDLVERFERNRESYQSTGYNETQLRREFLDPLFVALGWDVDNRQGRAEAYKYVIHEDAIKVGGATNFLGETGTPLRGGYFRMKTAYLNPFPLPVDKMSHGTESVLHDALVLNQAFVELGFRAKRRARHEPGDGRRLVFGAGCGVGMVGVLSGLGVAADRSIRTPASWQRVNNATGGRFAGASTAAPRRSAGTSTSARPVAAPCG